MGFTGYAVRSSAAIADDMPKAIPTQAKIEVPMFMAVIRVVILERTMRHGGIDAKGHNA